LGIIIEENQFLFKGQKKRGFAGEISSARFQDFVVLYSVSFFTIILM